jgi:hypothetical protein
LNKSGFFIGLQMNRLLGNPLAEHFILRLEELDLADQLIAAATGQHEEQRLAGSFHDAILLRYLLASESAELFVHRHFSM